MDDNKKKVLQEIKYEVHKCCGLCANFMRSHQNGMFGTCIKNGYEHLKHNESQRELSVTIYGGCPDWEEDRIKKNLLHGFAEFQKGS